MPTAKSGIVLHHNLDPAAFKWLWAKYVTGADLTKHCTACLKAVTVRPAEGRGSPYSQRFSRPSNPGMKDMTRLVMDEVPVGSFLGIYLCGVAAAGYSAKKNYPHNLHAAIVPVAGGTDTYEFEKWVLRVENGLFTRIPGPDELPPALRGLPDKYTTCRIFRWAACIVPALALGKEAPTGVLLHPSRQLR